MRKFYVVFNNVTHFCQGVVAWTVRGAIRKTGWNPEYCHVQIYDEELKALVWPGIY